MSKFKSGWAYIHFADSVRERYRYAHTEEVGEFLRTLVATSTPRIRTIPAKSTYWRAQLGYSTRERKVEHPDLEVYVENPVPFPAERMKPRRSAANEGRVNPKGIPCLYLATDKETAMAEVRPWLDAKMSVARFLTTRDLRIVDVTVHHDTPLTPDFLFTELPDEKVIDGTWAQVDRAFSEPVSDDPSTAEYVPTQVIAEVFRREGLDGLVYKSKLGDGFNLALFDLNSAELARSSLFTTKRIAYQFAEDSY